MPDWLNSQESFCLDQNEHGDLLQEASVESAEHQKMSHIMEEAMRIATEHANEHMEKRMKELAMRERDLADSTRSTSPHLSHESPCHPFSYGSIAIQMR